MLNKIILVAAIAALSACGGDSSNSSEKSFVGGEFGTTFPLTTTGDNAADYLLTSISLSAGDSVNATGAGIEHSGWNYYYSVRNTLFVFHNDDAYAENGEGKAYQVNASGEQEVNSFVYDGRIATMGSTGNTLLATNAYWGAHSPLKLHSFDSATGAKQATVEYSIYDDSTGIAGEGTVPWVTALVVRDDKLFIPYLKFNDDGSASTPDANKGYVAIFDYPMSENAKPIKIIEDNRISNIGAHGATSGLILTDVGDLYGFSNGEISAGFFPASTNPSAIVRIAKGETEFDANYLLDIEASTDGGKIIWFDYVGNEKALARIVMPTDQLVDHDNKAETAKIPADHAPWGDFESKVFRQKLVIIDLANKSITDVAGIPLHAKRNTPSVNVTDNGTVYVSIETADDAYVYEVDIAAATAVKGAQIEGATIRAFYQL
jgi:hypothetical protein